MSSPDDGEIIAALRGRLDCALTLSELQARLPSWSSTQVAHAAQRLAQRGVVVVARAAWSDPHLPEPIAVALVDSELNDDAVRARMCLAGLERQLLAHRCC